MSSTFSNLKFELIANGEQSGQWGTTTNNNIGTAIEQAIVGMATLETADFTANVCTLTLANTNAAQDARALCLNITATLSGAGTVNVPAIEKPYIVINNSSGGYAVTVKVSGQTGVSVPSGKRTVLYNNGTDIGEQITHLTSLAVDTLTASAPTFVTPTLGTPVSGNFSSGTFTWPTFNQNTSGTAAGLSATLAVASGGTGATSLTANNVILGNGTSAVQTVAPGASGNVLTSDGTTWTSSTPVSSGITAGQSITFALVFGS